MEFEIEKTQFLKTIQKVQSIADRKTPVPLLNNVRIQVDNNTMEVSATDLEVCHFGHIGN